MISVVIKKSWRQASATRLPEKNLLYPSLGERVPGQSQAVVKCLDCLDCSSGIVIAVIFNERFRDGPDSGNGIVDGIGHLGLKLRVGPP